MKVILWMIEIIYFIDSFDNLIGKELYYQILTINIILLYSLIDKTINKKTEIHSLVLLTVALNKLIFSYLLLTFHNFCMVRLSLYTK